MFHLKIRINTCLHLISFELTKVASLDEVKMFNLASPALIFFRRTTHRSNFLSSNFDSELTSKYDLTYS